jgi:hypothetical protein
MNRALLIAVCVAVLAVILALSQCQSARNANTRAEVSDSQAGATAASGADAVGTVGAVADRDADTDQLTRENADAIRNAPGASAPIDPDLRGVGLASLCRRAAYRSRAECVQYASPDAVAGTGGGSAPADR